MKSNGAITATVTLLALALAVSPASANPLLSGYGGPGEGNQAILGSALLNGPSGGGSGSAGSGGSAAGGGLASARGGSGLASAGGSGQAPSAAGRGRRAAGVARTASGSNGSQTQTATPSSAASHAAVPGAQTLGISGADLLDIMVALGVLLATGALTRRLAYRPH
jgi:hypothetical protein